MSRLRSVLVVVALLGLSLATAASAETSVDRAVASWRSDGPGVYVDDGDVGHPLTASEARRLDTAIGRATTPFFVAQLGDSDPAVARLHLRELIDTFHKHGTYIVVGDGGFLTGSDVAGVEGATEELSREATAAHRNDPVRQLLAFVRLADAAAGSVDSPNGAPAPDPAVSDSDSDSGGISWLPIVVVIAIGVGVVALIRRGGRQASARNAAAFADVRRAADEDVTLLGEELTALDVPPASSPEASADYAAALNAYEQAKDALERSRRPEDLRAVTSALEDGRWRLACVRARLSGQPVPERRPPCFFNPQHGPSTSDMAWAPAGGAPREVPVCAADADRLARGEDPETRMVTSGGRSMPYWQGPAYFGPYAGGFFGGWGGGFLGGLLVGEMLSAPAAFADYGGGHDMGQGGYDDGADMGDGGDFASDFDVGGGGDWGGGDFGGGDFGGGDFGGGGDW